MKNIRVGFLRDTYFEKRCILNIVQGAEYKRVLDYYSCLYYIIWGISALMGNRLKYKKSYNVLFSFRDFNLNNVDLLHFANVTSYGRTPWITTFETVVPRYEETIDCHHGATPDLSILKGNRSIERALSALAGDSCKRIIAISECNLQMQKELLRHFPTYKDSIEKKLCAIHPPQNVYVSNFWDKDIALDGSIRFLFVGRDFFRKGGMETLRAFERLRGKYGFDLKLIIVSPFSIGDHAIKEVEVVEDIKKAKQIIDSNSEWIEYYRKLPNSKVIELMKKSHIGLLPTWAETYGGCVLEFQSTGCPVISTNVRALPEINDENMGWVINIPKNRLGEAIYTTPEQQALIRQTIEKGLEDILVRIFSDRERIIEKSNNAISNIRSNHSLDKYSSRLQSIYNEAV